MVDDPPSGTLLRVKQVRGIVIAFGTSLVGNSMLWVAVAFGAYDRTGSVVATAIAFGGTSLPLLVLAPVSVRLLNRHDLRTVLMVGQAGKVLVAAGASALAATGELGYGGLVVAIYLYGAATALGSAGWSVLEGVVAPRGRLPDVAALLTATQGASAILGCVTGGALLTLVGEAWVFALAALSFVPAIVFVLSLPAHRQSIDAEGSGLRQAGRLVRDNPVLHQAFVVAAAVNAVALPLIAVLPKIASDIDPRGHVLGLLTGAFYGGGILVAWAVTRLRRRYAYSQILFVGLAGTGALMIAHALLGDWRGDASDAVVVAAATLLPIGLAIAVNVTVLQSLVLLGCPEREKPGVMALYVAVGGVLTPVGGILLGIAIDSINLWVSLAAFGLLLVGLSLVGRSRLRVFDEVEGAGQRSGDDRFAPSTHWRPHTDAHSATGLFHGG